MRILGLVWGTAVLISCASAADYFPLQAGNVWAYRNGTTGEQITMSVGTPVMMNEREYFVLRGYASRTVLVRLNERKELVQADEDSGREQVLTSFVPLQGGWWDAPLRGCREMGQTFDKGAVHDGPAGPFHDVLEIYYQTIGCADFGTELEQFAPNIGMVRRTTTSIAGPRTYDLIYARVGSVQIETAPHAAFSVSFAPVWPAAYNAFLRLHTNVSQPLKLRFPSGQEFEATLTDESGKVVWRWSDGKVFAQAEHETTVSGDWAIAVPIPDWVLSSSGSQPLNYTLQAWLTTTGSSTSFSAALPVSTTTSPAR
jgi:hypothetical protein